MYSKSYYNAQEAFESLYELINIYGYKNNGTKILHDVLIDIKNPLLNDINTKWRKWNKNYADYEWQWYLSKNPNANEISKKAKLWKNIMDKNGNVNSNYGYQWNRNNQLNKIINLLKRNPSTRRASISIYDGKEIDIYEKDTPCTYSINFYINKKNKLCMQVMMRSNDLIYGFCNDQYCFSKLQGLVANELNLKIGNYIHYVCNMHIYEKHYKLKEKNEIL